MIRKWMMMVLSLLLALMLPLSSMAATQHTLTIIPGDELAAEPAIADLLDVLSITLTPGEKSGALTLTLDGEDIATIALGADTTALYAYSNLLSDEVLHVTWDDAFALIKNAIEASAAEQADEEQIALMLAQVDQAKEQLIAGLGGGLTVSASVTTKEEAMEQAAAMFGDDPKMMEYIEGVYEHMVVEDGSFTDEARDTADQKYSLNLTQEDVVAVFESSYMQQILRDAISQENPSLSDAELDEQLKTQLDEMRKLFENSQMDMAVTAYTLDEGDTLVGMEMDMEMTVTEDGASETAAININYDRLTTAEGVSYKADVRMADDSAELLQILFDFHRGVDGVSDGMLAFLVEGEELLLKYDAENTEADVRQREVALYLRSNAAAIVEPVPSDRPLIAFRVVSSPADPLVLSAIEAADTANSVDVMKLSEEEMEALYVSITSHLMEAAFTAMGKLPTSTLNLVLSMMGIAE